MTTHAHDADPADSAVDDGRYAALSVGEDAVVIYDRSNHDAWVQSDNAVGTDGMC